ncbi:vitelline membrane outer layer protein 1-like [Tiliqua scincoides]|uniref:vitelline membrane outer layer protein 1-like n=1 Tax=Tiliqua scincoides TaxID=71010 RepID=UPI0034630D8E
MDLSVGTLLFLILACCLWDSEARFYQHIWVENGVKNGYYSNLSLCPKGYAHGFSLKIQEYQGSLLWQDDTSLNGIRLYCSDGSMIQSNVGELGVWSAQQYCYSGNMNAFRLRVDPPHGWGMAYDDTAANNIQFKCESGEILEGYGYDWGTFGSWSSCHSGSICGLQTRVETAYGEIDKTALNDVIFLCCPPDR